MKFEISEQPSGLFTAVVTRWESNYLAAALDPSIPYALIERHAPLRTFEWADMRIPLSLASAQSPGVRRVRLVTFDACLDTEEFISVADELTNGFAVWQCERVPASTLCLSSIPARSRALIYAQNGVRLSIYLPTRLDPAVLASIHRPTLESCVRRIAALV